jgi:hypothetical protein
LAIPFCSPFPRPPRGESAWSKDPFPGVVLDIPDLPVGDADRKPAAICLGVSLPGELARGGDSVVPSPGDNPTRRPEVGSGGVPERLDRISSAADVEADDLEVVETVIDEMKC